MSEELKKEWERNIDDMDWSMLATKERVKTVIRSLLAKQQDTPMGYSQWLAYGKKFGYFDYLQEEIIADLKKDPLRLIKFAPYYKDASKDADERIQIQIDAYNDAKEEFMKELATIKRWVMTIRDNNAGTVEDEYVVREKDLQRVLADIKSKLKI
jgi:hypothetical protein